MNRIVAAFAGKLSDLGGLPDGQLRAPIFRHPRFERLEMDLDDQRGPIPRPETNPAPTGP